MKNLIGKKCFYRPLNQRELVETVVSDMVCLKRATGEEVVFFNLENGATVEPRTLLFASSDLDGVTFFSQR